MVTRTLAAAARTAGCRSSWNSSGIVSGSSNRLLVACVVVAAVDRPLLRPHLIGHLLVRVWC
jgi:hypothetical protein